MRESHAKGCTAPLLPPTNCWSPGPDCRLRLGFSSLTIYTRQAYIFSLELSEKNAKRIAPPGDRPPRTTQDSRKKSEESIFITILAFDDNVLALLT